MRIIVNLDNLRRAIVHVPAGGVSFEERVHGIGWVEADGEDWSDAPDALRSAACALMDAVSALEAPAAPRS